MTLKREIKMLITYRDNVVAATGGAAGDKNSKEQAA